MISTHPKVGVAVLVGVRVKAKVRALARRDAHSFLPCGRFAASQRCGTLLRLLFSHLRGGLYLTG